MDKAMNKFLDPNEIRRWHKAFKREGELFEVRLLGDKTFSGYFTNVEDVITAVTPFDQQKAFQIYFTVNEVNPACSSRKQFGVFMQVKNSATSKNDIIHRWWLPIDIDVKRPSDVSSTNEEKSYAYTKASEVYKFLQSNGFSTPIVCDSSSGYHLYYPVDLENTDESDTLVHQLFDVLSARFTDDRVKIDKAVTDANRIMRMPGTWGRKGRDSKERPHRMAKVLSAQDNPPRMKADFLSQFIGKYKVVEEKPANRYGYNNNNEQFDLRKFISDNGLKVRNETSYGNGGVKFVLEECPFDSSHKAPDSAIFQTAQGAIGFKCFHDSCSHHDWHELRQMLDPTAYEEKPYQGQQQYRTAAPKPAPQPVIKPETPELGKKWFSMTDIVKVNINELEHVKTGFKELDRFIKGLFFFELIILSGTNSSGKSSWLNTLLLNIIQQGYKVALWSGELRSDVLKSWIQMVAAGKQMMRRAAHGDYWYVPNEIGAKIDQWLNGKFFIYNNEYSNKWEQIFNDMKELLARGVRVFVLDNLFSLDIDIFAGDNNKNQKALIKELSDFAKQNKVIIILVAHPRKVSTFIRKTDISGTSDITNAADDVFIIHRVNQDFMRTGKEFFGPTTIDSYKDYGNVIEVAKNRLMGQQDLLCGMYYEIESRRFKNSLDEVINYGWRDDIATQANMFDDSSDLPFTSNTDEALPF